ncbi:Multidrug resistance protein, partial [Friedmanniomyces endolithicus]
MSLVGNFAFGNADRTTATAGAGDGGLAFQHQAPNTAFDRVADDDDAHDQERRGSATSAGAATGRPQSNRSGSRYQAQGTSGTGIHNGTYYADGITPEDEKDVEKGKIDKRGLALSDTPSDETDEKEQARREFEVTELAKTLT